MNEQSKMLLAFQRATLDLEKSFAPDPFKYCDYEYQLDETLKVISYHLKEGEYRSKRVENFDLPKGEFAIRPGVIVDILDLTLINRLLVDFIFKLDRKLPAGVTAYRLRRDPRLQFRIELEPTYFILSKYKREKIKIEEPWYNLWPEYRKELLLDLKSGKYSYVAVTDITAYFEDINHITLGEILKKKAGSNINSINMIMEIYNNWALRDPANVRQRRGLPQGSVISGVLSNYYLDIIDTYLENEKKRGRIKWYRYCDDIHVLCKTRPEAIAILLKIGSLLRQLGLKQNAEKTRPLTTEEAIVDIQNEISENITAIIEDSQNKRANRYTLIGRLRNEYKKISRRKTLTDKVEVSLMRTYTAARILDTPLLTNRVGDDFIKLPMRSKSICSYGRQFINYKPVFRAFSSHLKDRNLLHNYQLAFLVTAFRNLKKKDKNIFKDIKEIASDQRRHWYVRVQAINTLFYLGIKLVRNNYVKRHLHNGNHRLIRRAVLILLPLCCSPEEIVKELNNVAKDLNIATVRMANFLLSLITSKDFAINHLKKFKGLNSAFLTNQIWRLYFISLNKNHDVRKSFTVLLKRIKKKYYNYPIIKEHISRLQKLMGAETSAEYIS
jgi:hypothetical protein